MKNTTRQNLVKKIYSDGFNRYKNELAKEANNYIKRRLKEDAHEDITVDAVLNKDIDIKINIIAKENGVLAGLEEVDKLFSGYGIKLKSYKNDGNELKKGDIIAEAHASNRDILKLERTGLNILQRMSGIATKTKRIVGLIKPRDTAVVATRKTMQSYLDKKAVMLGGGLPHRMGLYDSILIKDNHLDYIKQEGETNPIETALARAFLDDKKTDFVEIEVETLDNAITAARYYNNLRKTKNIEIPLIIMLDNISPEKIKEAIARLKKHKLYNKVILEASGMINEKNILKYAKTGVDAVSLGALTHTVRSLDISMKCNINKNGTNQKNEGEQAFGHLHFLSPAHVYNEEKTDFIVIGSGIAGLNFAAEASKYGQVTVITKKDIMESNTNYAQGGIAAVLDKTDTAKSHIKDTLIAGCYHNDKKAVEYLVKEGPKMIKKLLSIGTPLEQKSGVLKLTREGGHSARRVAFSRDTTGQAIEEAIVKHIKNNKKIKVIENAIALDLITHDKKCYGVQYLIDGQIKEIYGKAVILATGGAGQIFMKTTNPEIATGDGLAIASRAGAILSDLEFIQFHPTALHLKGAPPFLISEAVRGEGAILKNSRGMRFMKKYHKMQELAPRDIVARAIYNEAKNGPVYLDISHEDSKLVRTRFPGISKKLKKYGLDISREQIPIMPAAHYICGGIKVNLNGKTNIKNLFAFGEAARTGVHGANRLASNSLLESIVFSNRIIGVLKTLNEDNKKYLSEYKPQTPRYNDPQKNLSSEAKRRRIKKQVQELMWEYVGLIRTEEGLLTAIRELKRLEKKLPEGINHELAETRNMVQVGLLMAGVALKRKKSLGCHYINNKK